MDIDPPGAGPEDLVPNIGPDGMPLDETNLIFGVPIPTFNVERSLDAAIPSLPFPADYPPAP